MTDTAESPAKRANPRDGKSLIGAYIEKDSFYAIQGMLLEMSRGRGERVTMQEAITEALTDYCKKNGTQITIK
jgi:hypothetical protein